MLKEIYIIDDDESSILVFNKLFENDKEYKFISVKSDQIDIALKNIPSIIIINEDAIEVDIVELCKKIRSDDDNSITPIIVVSSNPEKEHRIQILKESVEDYIKKLETRVNELLKPGTVDEERLAQEIVIFSDKSSIEEELTRLDSHLEQFLNLLKGSSPVGKKMDFLVQEINRETNTIGSKANCLEITNLVIEIKTEVENIREQVQNIE